MNFPRAFIAMAEERDQLRLEVKTLQLALRFWMPGAPLDDAEILKRVLRDAPLLKGLGLVEEKSAKELGWIKLRDPRPTEPP